MHPPDQRHDRGPDQLLEHRFLVLEVQVDRALGNAGAFGHVIKPGRGKAAGDELLQRRLDDRGAPFRRGSARLKAGCAAGESTVGALGRAALLRGRPSPDFGGDGSRCFIMPLR
jgi:hypothetical protein